MHHGEHTAAAAHCWWQHALLQPSLDEELSKFVGVDVRVEADTGLCHLTRLMKLTACNSD